MSKISLTKKEIERVSKFLKTGRGEKRTQVFVNKHQPKLIKGILYQGKRVFIPREKQLTVLRKVVNRGMPINSIAAAHDWLSDRFVGFLKKDLREFVKAAKSMKPKKTKVVLPEGKTKKFMNKYKFTDKFVSDLLEAKKGKKATKKAADFLRKFPSLQNKAGKLFYDGKQIISETELPTVLQKELTARGCPMAVESAFNYCFKKYIGMTRAKIGKYINSLESVQLMKRRPVNPEVRKGGYSRNAEGATRFLLDNPYLGDKNHCSTDLMQVAKHWSNFKYILVVVHVRSGMAYFEPLLNKKPQSVLTKFKKIQKLIERRFGKIKLLTSDQGGEFLSVFRKYLLHNRIKHFNQYKAYTSEKKISQFGRYLGELLSVNVPWKRAFVLASEKVNNVKSRITGKTPIEFKRNDVLKAPRRLNQHRRKMQKIPVFKTGQRCRYLRKPADSLNPFYKSYWTGDNRTQKYQNWTKRIYVIEDVRQAAGLKVYKVDGKYRKPWHLQIVQGSVNKLIPQKATKEVKKKAKKIKKKEPAFRKVLALESELGSYWSAPLPRRRPVNKVTKPVMNKAKKKLESGLGSYWSAPLTRRRASRRRE